MGERERRGHTGRDTLDASTTGEPANGGLGNALDVGTENDVMTSRAAFAKAFTTFSACRGEDQLAISECS